jgi:ankyrin repeat protein
MVSLKKMGLRKCSNILNEATEKGRKDIVELLLDKSANVNIRKQDGSTALHSGI